MMMGRSFLQPVEIESNLKFKKEFMCFSTWIQCRIVSQSHYVSQGGGLGAMFGNQGGGQSGGNNNKALQYR